MQYRFQWDPIKAQRNLEKHGVSFREAEEDANVLDVRIISARRATKQEIRCYEEED